MRPGGRALIIEYMDGIIARVAEIGVPLNRGVKILILRALESADLQQGSLRCLYAIFRTSEAN